MEVLSIVPLPASNPPVPNFQNLHSISPQQQRRPIEDRQLFREDVAIQMSFRKIRPSGEGSASTSNPSQSTPETTGSDPRHPRASEKDTPESSSSSKRRRVPESVTRNACLNCKKARAKCDGKKPCKRCATRVEASDCIYEIHIKHAKEELVKQIKELRNKDHMTEQILQALSTDEKVPEILEKLRNGETYDSIVEWLGRTPMGEIDTMSPRESHVSIHDSSDHEMGGTTSTNVTWTSVTFDHTILDHLFQLYFAWVHPVHTLFHEGHFVDSYKRQSAGYCSPVLVNAICAMACHLHTVTDGDDIDFEQLGMDFSDAVGLEIDAEDMSITTIQAFAISFLVDCARSNALRASSYLRIASSSLATVDYQPGEGFAEVWRDTVRGVGSLSVEWAQVTFQVAPGAPPIPSNEPEDNEATSDDANWYFYRFLNDQCPAWPGLLSTTNREKSKLTAIIHEMTSMLYAQGDPKVSAEHVLQQYRKFISWRQELPSSIRDIEHGNDQALPHVLSLLILYSSSLVQLLRPLLDLEGFPASQVGDIIWQNAQQGLFLLDELYRTKYTCRYQPVLQMFSVLHLTDVIARYFPGGMEGRSKDGPDAVRFGLESLLQSRSGFPIAGPLQEMLRRTADECSLRLPIDMDHLMSTSRTPHQSYRINDLIDACTRPTYTQPVKQINARYMSSFSTDWLDDGVNFGFPEPAAGSRLSIIQSAEERGAQSLMLISNLLNTG